MWIARDKNGNLFLYNTELTRNENGVWFPADYQPSNPFYCVKLPSDLFPEQTWEDAPLEVEIKRLPTADSERRHLSFPDCGERGLPQ